MTKLSAFRPNVRQKIRLALAFPILLITSLLMACSTPPPEPNKRKGFIQDLNEQEKQTQKESKDANSSAKQRARKQPQKPKQREKNTVDDQASVTQASPQPHQTPSPSKLNWPVKNVEIKTRFGDLGSRFHEGVNLAVDKGTAVYSAHAGEVVYAGKKIDDYGKLVVIQHGDSELVTVYAHNSKLLVKKGEQVKSGEKIALSGQSGKAKTPYLHFEIRRGVVALDPVKILGKP